MFFMVFAKINTQRLLKSIDELSKIGQKIGGNGVTRRAMSPAEDAAKRWLIGAYEEINIPWREDGAGNIIARYGTDHGAAVATGSHLDSVPNGGHLDGAFGVLAGLEVLRTLKSMNAQLARPIEVIAFTDEEGRFGSMIGSKCMSGGLSKEELLLAEDEKGRLLGEALSERSLSIDSALQAKRAPEEFYCFVELHIEQGPVLDQSHLDLGVVEDIVGIVRWRARFTGEANHAGTTPMHLRKDAFVGLTQFAEKIPTLLKDFGSSAARATIGEVSLEPGYIGVVPASAHFTLDLRDISQSHLNDLHTQLQQHAQMVAEQLDLGFELTPIGELPCTSCDPRITSAIEAVVKKMGKTYIKLPSGATHDALPMSTLCPIGMIFVPSVNGISHSSYEHTEAEHLCLGAQALLETILTLAQGEHCVDKV